MIDVVFDDPNLVADAGPGPRGRVGRGGGVAGGPDARVPVRAAEVRGDSTFYSADIVKVALRHGAQVSLTVPASPVRDAAIAGTGYGAFTSRAKRDQVYGRLIVRRVKRLNPPEREAQGTLFDTWRYHAVFVTGSFELLQAESHHRGHAVVERIFADAGGSALAHLPSGSFSANAAWALVRISSSDQDRSYPE